jgi:hypothetical protein
VPIYHHCWPAIVGCPVVTDRQSEFVDFTCGFAEQRKIANFARPAPLHFVFHSRVCHYQLAAIKNIMADQSIQKLCNLLPKFRRLLFQLR